MNYKLNHVLFSRKGGASFLSWKAVAAATAIVLLLAVATNWDYLTKSAIERFQDAYEARRFDEALALAEQYLAENPDSAEAYRAIILTQVERATLGVSGAAEQAVSRARDLLALDSENPETRRLLGYALEISGDFSSAEAQYKAGLERDPKNPWLMGHLANLYRKTGRSSLSRDLLQRAVLIAPEEGEIRVLAARFFLEARDPDGAIEIVGDAVNDPRPLVAAEANRILAAALVDIGEIKAARPPAEKAIALAPDSAAALQNYGDLLLAEAFGPEPTPFVETLEEARRYADRAIELNPSLSRAYFLAFKVAYSQKEVDRAREYGRLAIESSASDSTLSPLERSDMLYFIKNVPNVEPRINR